MVEVDGTYRAEREIALIQLFSKFRLKTGGNVAPALLVPPSFSGEMPPECFCIRTKLVSVPIVTQLEAALTFINMRIYIETLGTEDGDVEYQLVG